MKKKTKIVFAVILCIVVVGGVFICMLNGGIAFIHERIRTAPREKTVTAAYDSKLKIRIGYSSFPKQVMYINVILKEQNKYIPVYPSMVKTKDLEEYWNSKSNSWYELKEKSSDEQKTVYQAIWGELILYADGRMETKEGEPLLRRQIVELAYGKKAELELSYWSYPEQTMYVIMRLDGKNFRAQITQTSMHANNHEDLDSYWNSEDSSWYKFKLWEDMSNEYRTVYTTMWGELTLYASGSAEVKQWGE